MPVKPGLFALKGPARCQVAFTAPFAVLAGAMFGLDVAQHSAVPALLVIPTSASAMVAFVAMQFALEPVVVEVFSGRHGRWAPLVAYAWDAATGTAVGLPVVAVLGSPSLPGVGAAATAGAVYGWVMGFFVCGSGAEGVVRLVLEGGGRRSRRYSYARSLAAQGQIRQALELYRTATAEDPLDPEPYLGIASIQARQLGDADGAMRTLRQALRNARLTDGHAIIILKRMHALCAEQGRGPAVAADLARFVDSAQPGPAADWARKTLLRVKGNIPEAPPPGAG